jgi:NAD(P)-dependent dehydrogenase (short-subunit alcohol dehydrogenase family)
MMSLEGRVAVITGATGGLGRVAARAFSAAGANLALLSSDQAKLDALLRDLGAPGDRVLVHAANLSEAAGAQSAASALRERFGRADILLHLVGGWTGGKELTATDPSDLKSMLDQHVWSTFYVLQAFVPLLQASGNGRVIVVSSPAAVRPRAKGVAYAAAKAAEEAMIRTLAEESGESGLTATINQVNAIDTEHQREHAPSAANASWATPEEIAAAMLYLCSEAGGAVNGQRLPLTRGGA